MNDGIQTELPFGIERVTFDTPPGGNTFDVEWSIVYDDDTTTVYFDREINRTMGFGWKIGCEISRV